MHWHNISNISENAQIHWEIFPEYIWWSVKGGERLLLCWYECRMDILPYMHVWMKGMVMGSHRNLLEIIKNLLELWAFLWKCELLKCLIIFPFIYNILDITVPWMWSDENSSGQISVTLLSLISSLAPLVCPQSHRDIGAWASQATPSPRVPLDFIEKLPRSSGYDTILIIVDRLTKQSIFIPTVDTITAPMLA